MLKQLSVGLKSKTGAPILHIVPALLRNAPPITCEKRHFTHPMREDVKRKHFSTPLCSFGIARQPVGRITEALTAYPIG